MIKAINSGSNVTTRIRRRFYSERSLLSAISILTHLYRKNNFGAHKVQRDVLYYLDSNSSVVESIVCLATRVTVGLLDTGLSICQKSISVN